MPPMHKYLRLLQSTPGRPRQTPSVTNMKPFFVVCLCALNLTAMGADHPELKAFPPAKDKMERFVIVLPHKERGEEDDFKVELIAGKMMPTDGVNLVHLGVSIEPRDLKGWGYTYYNVV
ncbi:MAG: ecotin family protein, partial [Pseudomonadota bacterium]